MSKVEEILISDDHSTTACRTILVVEDEGILRLIVAEYLRDSGFCVVEASNGDEAIVLLEGEDRAIDIVFSDIRMPGSTNGLELARWVRAHKPATQIILTSGYIDEATEAANLGHHETVLKKPYQCFDLLRRIQSLVGVAGQV
nr:response regulator [uncultured Rhodopila sp.]